MMPMNNLANRMGLGARPVQQPMRPMPRPGVMPQQAMLPQRGLPMTGARPAIPQQNPQVMNALRARLGMR